jgi:pimeloyl-ACP methyl ester carboxylesterase
MPVIAVNNIQVNYHDQGDPYQPVLLLIHGLGCSMKYWTCLFDAEELSAFRIIALDLPGFGMSEKPDDYDYQLSSQADIVQRFLHSLDIQEFSLIGHSMGGSIAILMTLDQAQTIQQLLVIEPNLKASDAQLSRTIVQYTESAFIEHYEEFQASAIQTVESWLVNFQQSDLDEYIHELLKTTPISMYRSAHSLITTTSDSTLIELLQRFSLPKYFLVGEETVRTHPIPREFQTSDIHTIAVPGVGHMMMIDNPSLFTKTLVRVLQ